MLHLNFLIFGIFHQFLFWLTCLVPLYDRQPLFPKNPNNFWHLYWIHSEVIFCVVFIINPSYLYWLVSKIPSAKKYTWIHFVLLWDSFLCILCLLLWWWSSWSSVCNCNVDNTSLYGVSSRLLLAVLVRNLGYVNVPFSYFFMPHFPDRRGR